MARPAAPSAPADILHAAVLAARALYAADPYGCRASTDMHYFAARQLAAAIDAQPDDGPGDDAYYAVGEPIDAYAAGEFVAALDAHMEAARRKVEDEADDSDFDWGDDGRACISDALDARAADASVAVACEWLHAAWLRLDGLAGRIVMERCVARGARVLEGV